MLSLDHLPGTWRTRRAGALAVTAVVTLSTFCWLAITTSAGTGLAPHDQGVTAWAVDGRHPALTVIMQVFTALGSTVGLTVLTALCATLLFMRGHRVRALVLTLTMLGSSLLTVVLKGVLGRTRPSTGTLLGPPATTTSFPSGHSFNTPAFAGLLAGMVLLSTTAVVHRTLAIMAAAGATLLVGTSRVYLGYHWMTDVMAGWSLGLAWLCLATLAILWLQGRRRPTQAHSNDPSGASSATTSGVHGVEPPSA